MTIGAMESRLDRDAARRGRSRRFAVTGVLDDAAARDLATRIWSEGGDGAEAVVIDLTAVTSVDAGALEALFTLRDLLGRRLRIETGRARARAARHGWSALTRR